MTLLMMRKLLAPRPVSHVSGRAAASNPVVDLAGLEFPRATDLVGRHALVSDPRVDGVLGDAEMDSDIVRWQPRLGHIRPPSRPVRVDAPDDTEFVPFEPGLCGRD